MDKGDNLFLALEALEKEKNIPKDYMIEKIQQALTAAYHREYTANGEVDFVMDPKTMTMRMYALKTVADPVEDPTLEISRRMRKRLPVRALRPMSATLCAWK